MNKITRKNLNRKKKKFNSKKKNLIQKGGSKSGDFKIHLYYFDYNNDREISENTLTTFLKEKSADVVKPNSNKTQIIFVENFIRKKVEEDGNFLKPSHLFTRNSFTEGSSGIKILDNIVSPYLFVKKQIKEFENTEEDSILHGTIKYPKIFKEEDIHIFNCKINNSYKIKDFIEFINKNIKYKYGTNKKPYIIYFNKNLNDEKSVQIKTNLKKIDKGTIITNNSNSGFIFVSKNIEEYIHGDSFEIITNTASSSSSDLEINNNSNEEDIQEIDMAFLLDEEKVKVERYIEKINSSDIMLNVGSFKDDEKDKDKILKVYISSNIFDQDDTSTIKIVNINPKNNFEKILKYFNLKLNEVSGDGNCFFTCLAETLGGEKNQSYYRNQFLEILENESKNQVSKITKNGEEIKQIFKSITKLEKCNAINYSNCQSQNEIYHEFILNNELGNIEITDSPKNFFTIKESGTETSDFIGIESIESIESTLEDEKTYYITFYEDKLLELNESLINVSNFENGNYKGEKTQQETFKEGKSLENLTKKTFTDQILGNKDFSEYLLSNHFWANDSVISKLSKALKVGFLIIDDEFNVKPYEHSEINQSEINNFIILYHQDGNHYKYISTIDSQTNFELIDPDLPSKIDSNTPISTVFINDLLTYKLKESQTFKNIFYKSNPE